MRHLWLLVALPCLAQVARNNTLRVFSEFTRIDPFGRIVKQDRGTAAPRHILSPGVPRNGFSSLRIVVALDKPTKYILDIGQNPENAVKATLYKEKFEKAGEQWIPDGLELVKIPYESTFPDNAVPGQTAITFWLDMWVAKDAKVDRIKVEPQLWVGTRMTGSLIHGSPSSGDGDFIFRTQTRGTGGRHGSIGCSRGMRPLQGGVLLDAERLAPPVMNARAFDPQKLLSTTLVEECRNRPLIY